MAGMADDLVAVAETRDRVRDLLAQRYAEGVLDLDAYESRVDAAERAGEVPALHALIADLRPPAPASAALVVREPASLAAAAPASRVVSVFGSITRAGAWELPPRLDVRCICSSVTLDLRRPTSPATPRSTSPRSSARSTSSPRPSSA